MALDPDAIFAEWDQAIAELIGTDDNLKAARAGGNPASIARAWSTESRLKLGRKPIEAAVEKWLHHGG